MRSRLLVLLLCAGALVLACGPRAHSNEASTSASHATDNSGRVLATSLNVSVERGVQFAFHVTNNSEKGIELRFPSSQTHDFIVLDSIGREVWRWAGDRMFTSAMQTKMLGARETLKVEGELRSRCPSSSAFIATKSPAGTATRSRPTTSTVAPCSCSNAAFSSADCPAPITVTRPPPRTQLSAVSKAGTAPTASITTSANPPSVLRDYVTANQEGQAWLRDFCSSHEL